MIEYVVGPLVAALISLKFTDYRVKKQAEAIAKQQESIANITKLIEKNDKEALRKTMILVTPMSQAIKRLQAEVGIQ
nr:hypothetical protein 56 [Pelagibacteraceae bacterium]